MRMKTIGSQTGHQPAKCASLKAGQRRLAARPDAADSLINSKSYEVVLHLSLIFTHTYFRPYVQMKFKIQRTLRFTENFKIEVSSFAAIVSLIFRLSSLCA